MLRGEVPSVNLLFGKCQIGCRAKSIASWGDLVSNGRCPSLHPAEKFMSRTPGTRGAAMLIALALGGHGVSAGDTKNAKDLARYDARIKPADRQHWSYLPVKRPALPQVKNAAWVRNPIDAFVLARLEKQGWKPSPPAEPRAWLRRLYLDV